MTEEEKKAAEANALATAQEEAKRLEEEAKKAEDSEAKIVALEAEKQAILEREANYKLAYLKEKKKNEEIDPQETEEERIRRITREELANTRLSEIDKEEKELLKKTLKENKELKLAFQNKTTNIPTGGSSTEVPVVTSTVITPEQLAAFKARGWTDKDIERYKKNLNKYR